MRLVTAFVLLSASTLTAGDGKPLRLRMPAGDRPNAFAFRIDEVTGDYRYQVEAGPIGSLPAGWALDDGVGALFLDGQLTETVTRVPGAQVYRVEPDGRGGADERALPCRLLT